MTSTINICCCRSTSHFILFVTSHRQKDLLNGQASNTCDVIKCFRCAEALPSLAFRKSSLRVPCRSRSEIRSKPRAASKAVTFPNSKNPKMKLTHCYQIRYFKRNCVVLDEPQRCNTQCAHCLEIYNLSVNYLTQPVLLFLYLIF